MKKLKCVFIDMVDDRRRRTISPEEYLPLYSTFQGYSFNKKIESRVKELFGWTTDLMKDIRLSEFSVSIHVITSNYLRQHGVTQHFYSPHGPKYDDKYSYLHGMNLLAFEGYNRVHLIYTIKRISHIFQEKLITAKKKLFRSMRENKIKDSYIIPVDQPRIGILTPTANLTTSWAQDLNNIEFNIISDDIRNLVPDIPPNNFVDYSLSRSYKYNLDDYNRIFDLILETV
ncbi:MAG: hypothetical protein ACXADY_25115 [Candidatus Hodarchaeales archaeon]|jgi:hypothetical protein